MTGKDSEQYELHKRNLVAPVRKQGFALLSESGVTLSTSGHNGASVYGGGGQVIDILTSDKVRVSGVARETLTVNSGYLQNAIDNELLPWAVEFCTDSALVEVLYQASTSPSFRLNVNGTRISQAFMSVTNGGGGLYRLRITPPEGRSVRTYCMQFLSMFPATISVGATETIWAAPKAKPQWAFLGDSYTQQNGGENWASTTAALLGVTPLLNGSGGTGYIQVNGAHPNLQTRLPDVLAADLDGVVIAMGINDGDGENLYRAVISVVRQLRTQFPLAPVFVLGPWRPGDGSASAQAAKATTIQTAAGVAGAYYIDNELWMFGTGKVGSTTGDGNADVYVSSDGIHPTLAGSQYLGARVAAEITNILRSI